MTTRKNNWPNSLILFVWTSARRFECYFHLIYTLSGSVCMYRLFWVFEYWVLHTFQATTKQNAQVWYAGIEWKSSKNAPLFYQNIKVQASYSAFRKYSDPFTCCSFMLKLKKKKIYSPLINLHSISHNGNTKIEFCNFLIIS